MRELRGIGVEDDRLREAAEEGVPWRRWGPYLSERSWATVRHDYSRTGDAWNSLSHQDAISRAYRWTEDGLGGICDDEQLLCLALAFWNGRDPILKERAFGLTSPQGNHGEDVKEYWWYLDATPTYSWMRWRYAYPQVAFPYTSLLEENHGRARWQPELELADTGIFDAGYWEITADYAKSSPEDLLLRITVRNVGPDTATLDVLPTFWFRNTWSWGLDERRPVIRAHHGVWELDHPKLGRRVLALEGGAEQLFCDNESNTHRLWGMPNQTRYPKDGINDHVVHGAPTVNPDLLGTKAAARYRLTVTAGASAVLRLRLALEKGDLGSDFEAVMGQRKQESDSFFAQLAPPGVPEEEGQVARQAIAGLLWSKLYYHFNIQTWLEGDASEPPPPAERFKGRNAAWRHLDAHDVVSVPDKWEYPWLAAWDLSFACVALARVDPEFAKEQLVLLCHERFMHPNGQLPANEWSLSEASPPVYAWAALRVWQADGGRDRKFLKRVLHKLLINYTWWVSRQDADGHNVLEGGFLRMGDIAPLDGVASLSTAPAEQTEGGAWMAMYSLNLLEMSLALAGEDDAYEDLACKFLDHFIQMALALDGQGIWDDEHGFYYDVLRLGDGTRIPLRARSLMGLVPLFATMALPEPPADRLPTFTRRLNEALIERTEVRQALFHAASQGKDGTRLLSIVSPQRLRRILGLLLDEGELLSPYGVRTLSRAHEEHPVGFRLGDVTARVDYEPGDSQSDALGGSLNWRGPVWFPINYLVLESLRRFHQHLGDGFLVECHTGSGQQRTLTGIARELERRLISIFLLRPDGSRPVFGDRRLLQQRPWRDQLFFYEYFHAETGAGLGASHQTGWTALVADMILSRSNKTDRQ
jgi:hypothetical protein